MTGEPMNVYVVCTRDGNGRYVHDATTREGKARATVERLAQGYAADGYELIERQHVRDGWHDDTPDVIEVLHLRNETGGWCNVELYATNDE